MFSILSVAKKNPLTTARGLNYKTNYEKLSKVNKPFHSLYGSF